MRVIVTGSRTWHEPERIEQTLEDLWYSMGPREYIGLTVIHGGCPTGADAVAHQWCQGKERVSEMVYPADWDVYGKRAGYVRNREMVEAGADIVLAFADWCHKPKCPRGANPHMSHGTEQCVMCAIDEGIEFLIFWSHP